ncbi:MAG: chemotaxis protein CheW [Nitrospirae bacterium]|nr:chemotaxis protein CheW [Nitrospirota bacterium]
MDIAKIRKKIKEEAEKEKQEDKAADDITSASGGGAQQQPDTAEKTEDSRQYIVDSIQGENPQPYVPAQVVSQQETVKEKSPAESVSKTAKPEEAISGIIELLTFQLAAEEFAFRISEVEEILTPQQITMVPKAPDYILGITSVRGKVMPVLDLKKRLSIKDNGASGKVRKKILTLKGPKGRIGIMIDRINGVIRIDESDIAEPPAHLSESDLMFVGGVVLYNGRFISVLRLEEAVDINLK